ncbi:MAG: MutS-related protein [Phocaeicola sp.]|uniref:MutS-related protein n=1 Tax=Phocaeicola sp. TaxID=2773926 RepID=UPI003FA0E16F
MILEDKYKERIQVAETHLNKIKKQILQVSTLRVFLFIAGVIGLIAFHNKGAAIIGLTIAFTFLPFLILVKYHTWLFKQKEWDEMLIKINRDEVAVLNNDYSPFDEGTEFIDPANRYSFDLDVFGPHSLFQLMNRTCTSFGKQILGNWLSNHSEHKEEIESRQKAVKELADLHEFRETFRVTGLLNHGNSQDKEELSNWAQSRPHFSTQIWVKPILFLIPIINMGLFLLGILNVLPFSWFGLCFCLFFIAGAGLTKIVNKIQSVSDKRLKILSIYAKLIQLIDKQELSSPLLVQLKSEFMTDKGKDAIDALKQLEKTMDRLDMRNNMFLFIFLEGLLFWQLRQVVQIEAWQQQYGKYLMCWLNALGNFDALCSLGNFAYIHPDYVYPTITDKPFIFEAKELGHPLMKRKTCVTNDSDIPSRPFFIIITGANMAGKSTYLRTIGINYVLACVGAPVYANSLTIYPAKLITSLRTTDSLDKHESYFFAELKRLKEIIDRLNRGEILFIILDEILKGTNSLDKQKGSFALIQQFMNLNANGIIATHDLLLGELIKSFPETIRNYCFEADITNNELTFSYQLRTGIAQNMNACFLMKKMGIKMKD